MLLFVLYFDQYLHKSSTSLKRNGGGHVDLATNLTKNHGKRDPLPTLDLNEVFTDQQLSNCLLCVINTSLAP